jgi:hypothetical protein
MEDLNQLFSREVMLPAGVSIGMIGLLLRGFARSNHRSVALEKQHLLHHRKPGDAGISEKKAGWLDRHLTAIANTTTISGAVITLASFFR